MTRMGDRRKGWLRDLRPGDPVVAVILSNRWILNVEEITPSGIITAGDMVFGPDGWRRERTKKDASADHLEESTKVALQEIRQEAIIRKAVFRMHDCTTKTLSYDAAVAILEILEEEDDEQQKKNVSQNGPAYRRG